MSSFDIKHFDVIYNVNYYDNIGMIKSIDKSLLF